MHFPQTIPHIPRGNGAVDKSIWGTGITEELLVLICAPLRAKFPLKTPSTVAIQQRALTSRHNTSTPTLLLHPEYRRHAPREEKPPGASV